MEKSSSLGISMSPQELSKKYKRQSLRMPQHPLFINKVSGHLSMRYIFIASYDMCYSWSVFVFFSVCFVLFAVINNWILAFLCGRETRSAFSCEYSYSSLIFGEYSCLAPAMLLAPVFHASLIQSC